MQVSKWGSSLAVRIPATVAEALDLHEGDQIELRATLEPKVFEVVSKNCPDERLRRLRRFRGRLPADFQFDRDGQSS